MILNRRLRTLSIEPCCVYGTSALLLLFFRITMLSPSCTPKLMRIESSLGCRFYSRRVSDLHGGRQLTIPYDCKIGWNRGEATTDNPDGLIEWTGRDSRKRTPPTSLLDQRPVVRK